MKILVTNDDGYKAVGIHTLVEILRPLGDITVVSPKKPQSGMSMAISIGNKPLAVKHLGCNDGVDWWYLDSTPASCVKYAIDNIFNGQRPDLVVSGINHGSNAAVAALYSGTVGAATEGVINGIRSIAVSLDTCKSDADFTVVRKFLPELLHTILNNWPDREGIAYNINFPYIDASQIRGIKPAQMGIGYWEDQFCDYNQALSQIGFKQSDEDIAYLASLEEGESAVMIVGDFVDGGQDASMVDHKLMREGWITVSPYHINNADIEEYQRLCAII